jgi:hypothetical protein
LSCNSVYLVPARGHAPQLPLRLGGTLKNSGYPERFAQEALGHNSKAGHRACAKRALMKIPSLEDYEQRAAAKTKLAA